MFRRFKHAPEEEPERADLRDHRPDRQLSLLEQIHVVTSEMGGGDPVEAPARVLAKRLNDPEIAADRGGGIVATHELVVQAL